MSFSTYANFETAITSWLDITASDVSSQIVDLITVGEQRIFRECRTRDMETSFGDTISSNGTLALPTGYIELKSAYIDTNPVQSLERRSPEWIRTKYPTSTTTNTGVSGVPKWIARYGTSFMFGPYPDSAYTVRGIYYAYPTPISGSGLSTFFTNNPDLYLFACLAESEPIIGRDSRIALWEAKYAKILADVNGQDQREDHSGSVLQMRVG